MAEKVNIYTEPAPGWILRRGAEELVRHAPEMFRISDHPAEVNYFLNYATYRDVPGWSVAMFTHLEEKGHTRRRFFEVSQAVDRAISMCEKTRAIITHSNWMSGDVPVIHFGSDSRMDRKLLFGVVGRTYGSGRKGEHLVARMMVEGILVRCWGKGWPCEEWAPGSKWEDLPDFYAAIDYLLITSMNEGGPIPLIDAIRAGVPVIAPRGVGWCDEFPCIRYDAGRWDSLHAVLHKLTHPPTWEQWAEQHVEFFSVL